MEETRLPRKAYDMLYDLDLKEKSNWVSKVKFKLFSLGFGFVWGTTGCGGCTLVY